MQRGGGVFRNWDDLCSFPYFWKNSLSTFQPMSTVAKRFCSFKPVCDQDSVMEFGFEPVCDQVRAGSNYLDMSR